MSTWPSYFRPKINADGTVTLYHGLNDEALDYVLTYEEFTPHCCAEGVTGLWFSISNEYKSFSSGYRNLTSIDVPLKDIGSRFRIMNEIDLFTEQPVKLSDYDFKLISCHGIQLYDPDVVKVLEKAANSGELDEILPPYDSIYYFVLDYLAGL